MFGDQLVSFFSVILSFILINSINALQKRVKLNFVIRLKIYSLYEKAAYAIQRKRNYRKVWLRCNMQLVFVVPKFICSYEHPGENTINYCIRVFSLNISSQYIYYKAFISNSVTLLVCSGVLIILWNLFTSFSIIGYDITSRYYEIKQ